MNLPHPSEEEDWTVLSPSERQNRIRTWRNEVKKVRERERRKIGKNNISSNWSLQPRKIEEDYKAGAKIEIGETFESRLEFELRLSEVCNILGINPGYFKSIHEKLGQDGRKYGLHLCCRSHSAEDECILKASLKGIYWVVTDVNGFKKHLDHL